MVQVSSGLVPLSFFVAFKKCSTASIISNETGDSSDWWIDPFDPCQILEKFRTDIEELWSDPSVQSKLRRLRFRPQEWPGLYVAFHIFHIFHQFPFSMTPFSHRFYPYLATLTLSHVLPHLSMFPPIRIFFKRNSRHLASPNIYIR